MPADAELAGFYAGPPGDVQQRANLPMSSTLGLEVGGTRFSAHVTDWELQRYRDPG